MALNTQKTKHVQAVEAWVEPIAKLFDRDKRSKSIEKTQPLMWAGVRGIQIVLQDREKLINQLRLICRAKENGFINEQLIEDTRELLKREMGVKEI